MLAFNGSRIGALARRVAQRFSILSGPDVEALENLERNQNSCVLVNAFRSPLPGGRVDLNAWVSGYGNSGSAIASGHLATPLVADTQDNVGEQGGRPNTT
jgi:hypothetical protein